MHLHASFLWYSIMKGCNSNYLLLSLPNLVVDCGDPGDPYGGYRHLATDTKYQAKVTYTCKADHHLEGDESQTCQADGQWSGTKPVCLGMHSWLNKIFLMTSLRWATFSQYQTKKKYWFPTRDVSLCTEKSISDFLRGISSKRLPHIPTIVPSI